ncbi:type II toxin-antitoxin system HicA family toxin [Candidatus Aerophobetes bacterium]|nr:type II toxin-antitoxin system HicA family toxin [Candidatus Aerophobetes bacterium]
MKRRKLIIHLKKYGCILLREGKRHSVYYNPKSNKTSTVPRHRELQDDLAIKICKDLGIKPLEEKR